MSKSLRDEIRAVLAVGIAAVVLSPAAWAQEQQKPEEQKEEKAASETEFQEVVVTGSRIRRTEFNSPSPVTVITTERSQLAGLLSTEEILRNTTAGTGQQINDSFSGFVTDGGPGANTISLRGLGAQRTLVLVNGRRWSPSGVQGLTNSVDLTAIPSSIISRIEILKDGASSIYGADAVAGVINVITKDSFDGLQLNGTGQATHDGGAERYTADISWGKVGDRGSFSISGRYEEQKELVAADRNWSRCTYNRRWTDQPWPTPDGEFVGDGIIDNLDPVTGEPLCFGTIYGLASTLLGFLRYEPGLPNMNDQTNFYYDPRVALYGNATGGDFSFYTRMPVNGLASNSWPLLTSNSTSRCPNLNDTLCRPLVSLYGNEGAYYNDTLSPSVEHIVAPRKSYSVTSLGQLDFDLGAGTTTAFYEAFWNRRETRSSGGHRQFFPTIYPVTWEWLTDETGTVPFGLNPYNPFASLIFIPGRGFLSDGVAQPVMMSWNIQDPNFYVDLDRFNLFGGLKGDLTTNWDYEFVVGYGRSDGTYRKEQWLDDRVFAATNRIVARPDGSVTCDDSALAEFPDCVPLNLFTEDALLNGVLPADAVAFISKMTKGKTVYDSKSVSAYATGPVFTLPAGAVKAVLGAEYREESIDDVPDVEAQANNYWGFSVAGITKGTDKVSELFTEVEVPLLSGRRFAEDMVFSGSLRWTDYDSYGDDITYKVALSYQITPQVLVRSTYGTSFRAPDLYEQFLGDFTGFASANSDPCGSYGQFYQPGDVIYDNCFAQGLDPETYRATSSIETITRGAGDLEAETSDALTIGLVFTPSFADVSFAIDYYDIQVENTIESPGAGSLAFRCYNSVGLTDPFCSRLGPRDVTGQFSFIDTSYLNIGVQQTRGYDFNFLYEHQFPSGSLSIDGILTYLDKQNYELFGTVTNLEGRWGFPRLSARTQVRYDWKDWRFGWFMDFIGESEEDPVGDWGDAVNAQDRQNRTPNILYHTLSVRYQQSNWEAIGTVRNVFDKDPPYVASGHNNQGASQFYNTLPGVGYDLLGRTYTLQLSYKF